jgi:hypothetical protein
VGQELTIGLDARSDGAQALARRVPAVTVRAVVDVARQHAGAARAPVPIAAAQAKSGGMSGGMSGRMSAGPIVDVSWSVSTVEPEEVIARLQSERVAAHAGFSHPHAAVGCAFCRRAAAVYR